MSKSAVIIGGGVIGTACAYDLTRSGWRVTVLDRGTIGGACSHGNCGYVCPSHVLPHAGPGAVWSTMKTLFQKNSPLKLRPLSVLSKLSWFLGFARRCNERDMLAAAAGIQALLNSSRTLYDELLAREPIACEWETKGLLFAFHTPHAFEHYAAVDAMLREKFAMPAERYDAAGMLKLEPALKPGVVSGGYLYKSDAQLRPDRLMSGWRTVVESAGGVFRENCEFTGFVEKNGRAVAAKTSQGEVEADAFVVATGAWTPLLNSHLGCKIPIVPGKGYSITMPRPSVCPTFPLIFEEHRVAVSPFQTGYRIGSTMEFAGYDTTMNPKRLGLLRDGATFYLKEPTCEPVQEEWWGWRPMVYDGKPIIDRSPKLPNVLIAAGHGMLGLSMATGTGKLVGEILNDQPPHVDAAAYGLKRFG
ncbi:NAD(P)/FAD-dependent oxidoreductase [Limnoglobus roseus]|uniref:FAD-dependent oxidoreductase n=1 Tax=Limnoglobus roseus TaxID=2598579 RepID=A0A5C1AMR7_9BACT|nr:FAD-dependent oxidoreductase [Limnoglobus roseus]QEL20280.1 FAD-dependent oxidoreductase [Limnoglobus roseus]